MSQTTPKSLLRVDEYLRLANAGSSDFTRIEMLDGEHVAKKAKTPLHDSSVDLVAGLLSEALPAGWYRRLQKVLITRDSCPEPDVAVVQGRPLDYQRRHPNASDCELVIEVADITVPADRRKAAIYARAGVPEYWLANLVDWQLERMTQPSPDGRYQQTDFLMVNDAAPLTIAGTEVGRISLRELLTPPA